LSATRYCAPDWNARLPFTVIDEPGVPLPGANTPPLIVVMPTEPVPFSVPPAFTVVIDEDAIEPLTVSVPPLIVVAPA
jgi:hypothetical protein